MVAPVISVQLYSVHQALEADLDGTLARLAGLGLVHVEAFDFVRRVPAMKSALAHHGLRSPTGHAILVEAEIATPDGLLTVASSDEVFTAAADLGVEVVIDPFVPPARWTTRSDVERTADRLNERAVQAAAYGLRVGYHNHDHELSSLIDGRPALEVLADLLEPTVALEIDLYWATAGGQDAAALLTRLGSRVVAVHAKDGPMRPGITAADLPTDQTPAGQGDVPLEAALAAGESIDHVVIEFDHYAGDLFEGIAASRDYLDRLLRRSPDHEDGLA